MKTETKTTELSTATFDAALAESDAPLLVDFWAPWCGPCQVLGPVIDEVAVEQEGKATVAKVNIDDSAELAARFGIRSIPTLIVFKNGEPAKVLNGVQSKSNIVRAIEEVA